jgi:hypothetical protein
MSSMSMVSVANLDSPIVFFSKSKHLLHKAIVFAYKMLKIQICRYLRSFNMVFSSEVFIDDAWENGLN